MIELDVDDYCEDCPHFEASVDKVLTDSLDSQFTTSYTIITCEHRNKCQLIYNYIKESEHNAKSEL